MQGQNFVSAVAYFSGHFTNIFPNAQVRDKNILQLSEVRTGQGQKRGHGCGRCKRDRPGGVSGFGRGGHGGGGSGDDLDFPKNIWNVVDIKDICRDFKSANWGDLQGDAWACFRRQHSLAKAGGGRENNIAYSGCGCGRVK